MSENKIVITGHTTGLGKAIYDKFIEVSCRKIVGLSRSTGYDIDKDFDKAWDSTEVLCETYNLPDNEEMMSILCEMIYQLGYKGVQNFKMMIKALQESDFVEAHYQMLDSRWRNQTKNRCEELAERMRDI